MLLDVFTEDTRWLGWSQERLAEAAQGGALVVNAVVLAEIAPRFSRVKALRAALRSMVRVEEIPPAGAFLAGHAHASYRRGGRRKRSSPTS